MRIENWELNIGQILPSLYSAKLFLREPLAPFVEPNPLCELGYAKVVAQTILAADFADYADGPR